MTRTLRARGCAAAALVLLAACAPADTTVMVSIPPPRDWAERLQRARAAKDEQFARSPDTPLLAEDVEGFEGLTYWEPAPDYYFVGNINLYAEPQRFTIPSTAGVPRPCEKVGWVGFRLDGQLQTLQVYRLLDVEPQTGAAQFFLPFMDQTTGAETYPTGRYVELDGPIGGPFVLDFNQAVNPFCAYGSPERFVCPVAPAENRLSVSIHAGERGYKQSAHGSS